MGLVDNLMMPVYSNCLITSPLTRGNKLCEILPNHTQNFPSKHTSIIVKSGSLWLFYFYQFEPYNHDWLGIKTLWIIGRILQAFILLLQVFSLLNLLALD